MFHIYICTFTDDYVMMTSHYVIIKDNKHPKLLTKSTYFTFYDKKFSTNEMTNKLLLIRDYSFCSPVMIFGSFSDFSISSTGSKSLLSLSLILCLDWKIDFNLRTLRLSFCSFTKNKNCIELLFQTF